jgi:hypothetical protein
LPHAGLCNEYCLVIIGACYSNAYKSNVDYPVSVMYKLYVTLDNCHFILYPFVATRQGILKMKNEKLIYGYVKIVIINCLYHNRKLHMNDYECPICFEKLDDMPYAKINNTAEPGFYHIECLEKWLMYSRNGLLTTYEIKSYSTFHNNVIIENITLPDKDTIVTDYNFQNTTQDEQTIKCCVCVII